MCIAKGSDVRPGVPLASLWCPLGSAAFAWQAWDNVHSDVRPGVPLASLWCPLGSAAFAWQAWDNVHCQGVGCTPWRPSGVPLVSLGLRCFCVAGVGQCAAKESDVRHGVPLASRWCPLGSAAFARQAWDNVHCQGV